MSRVSEVRYEFHRLGEADWGFGAYYLVNGKYHELNPGFLGYPTEAAARADAEAKRESFEKAKRLELAGKPYTIPR